MSAAERLAWDSDFFGFETLRAHAPPAGLEEQLARLRDQGARLVYWACANDDRSAVDAALGLGGRLVDRKTTYAAPLSDLARAAPGSVAGLTSIAGQEADEELLALAVAAGKHSRFAVDPDFPRDRYVALYERWLVASLRGERADAVFALRGEQGVEGLVTTTEQDGRGSIGLAVVAERGRGRGVGGDLLQAAHGHFASRGFRSAQVVTQGSNRAACALYEASGYRVEKVEAFFHFWL